MKQIIKYNIFIKKITNVIGCLKDNNVISSMVFFYRIYVSIRFEKARAIIFKILQIYFLQF